MSPLTKHEQRWLLSLARRAMAAALACSPLDAEEIAPEVPSERLSERAGAFVTLHRHGELRGCVGYIEPILPLYRTVIEGAVSAATRDLRFPAMSEDELGDLEVEISVLSALMPIQPDAVVIGTHGLVVTQGNSRGLLLPQVPVEHGWDSQRFIEETCIKAGFPPDAWREGAKLFGFTASIFSDEASSSEQ